MTDFPPVTTPVLMSAARTTAQAVELDVRGYSSLQVRINVTNDPSSASITPSLEGWDPAAGAWYTILAGAAITAVGTTWLTVAEWIGTVTNVSVTQKAPERVRFSMAVGNTDAMTYSVMAVCHE